MVAAAGIKITKVAVSKLLTMSLENIPFGKYFTDHMLEADFVDGAWNNVSIKPYQPLQLDPSLAAIHYGQSIFEGIKAYKNQEGEAAIFRPDENFKRFNLSAERMCMPQVPEAIFMEGMRQLIEIDKDWIPNMKDHALYIRPFMFSTDELLGVRPSDSYKFLIILSPTGPYYAKPMKILVEENYTRAAPGGVGFSKNAGNYGGSMMAAKMANKQGYDQVLWTDSQEHKWLQEVGMMNVFFLINGVAVTPSLEEGTILHGVTRKSVMTLLSEMGIKIEERRINVDELVAAYQSGQLQEVFGTGTAATIAPIKELKYKDHIMPFDLEKFKVSPAIKQQLDDIKEGRVADTHGWMFKV
ncbi:MAG: branched chain amino acid aminotransferase [Bacteroidetes bacterium 24-39-8]|jgi:branched-chain amino acid aminotransferase|nr:MAG: branched chain amino acid aminotransferase [Sphingobacteriia bacterium 35-40-8]OYZ47997.1 MAG: branched chain amino acid aminotransferase [Bacteroidetes bacterium 24-39-8]OZA68240.1 MAG: branched chain amino acid aminotransferase [Sphingobacteriia bacterium 39-39-8]HQR91703.1 branched-chain amino acid aminotransferase [Sediminibacterium sp.]